MKKITNPSHKTNLSNKRSKKIALIGILLGLAMIIGVIESFIPPIFPMIPFLKIGFSNIIIIFTLIKFDFKTTMTIGILKSILTPIVMGNPMMILYSLPSTALAILAMAVLKNSKNISITAVSITGAIVHNFIQVVVASFVMQTNLVFYYLTYLTLLSILSGFFVGLVGGYISFKIKIKI